MNMIVAPQMVPSLRQGFTNSGGATAQIEIGKRLSGIDVKTQTPQQHTSKKLTRDPAPDAVPADTKGGGSSSGPAEAKTGQGRTAELLSQGVDPAIVIAADRQIAAQNAKDNHGAYRKAQIREAAMLSHNRAQQGYASASEMFQNNLMRSIEKALDVRIGA